ncbi:polysaccharide pyruvyl transferase family protein [Aerococcus urinaeequi]|uniref:polysaccharide pyruvyl transferase family protein n=1 Tax=Aerococcus urinaeequi TaxID=51665 RepID=UPI003D6B732C
MKKIGIVTLLGYFNYGNRLQNYALQETLVKLGCEVTSLKFSNDQDFLMEFSGGKTRKERIINKIKDGSIGELVNTYHKLFQEKINRIKYKETIELRTSKFKEFTFEYINEQDYNGKINSFDYFVVGSDQVWNPNYIINKPQFLLNFAPPSKRISYSASFGISTLPEAVVSTYAKEIEKFKHISVREGDGKEIIQNLVNKEVPILVDPTMLLSKEEWLKIAKKANNRPNSQYILTYFLGGPSSETSTKVNKLAKERNMKVINLGSKVDAETYATDPSEFIDYINNASIFLTDSFHGVVFSIILQTPFIVYERIAVGSSMYSRIETLLNKFDLNNRQEKSFEGDLFNVDFSNTNEILDLEQKKSILYLKESLEL